MNTVDVHIHGLCGIDTRTSDETVILDIAAQQFLRGVSAFLPTIYPGPIDIMRSHLDAVRKAMQFQANESANRLRGESPVAPGGQARVIGAHIEGPFLNPLHAGALDPSHFLRPDERNLDALISGFEDVVRIVTLAPEMPGALPLITRLSSQGIVVSLGHSDATFSQAEEAYRAGAKGITHLFNAMRGLHHREPGIAGFGLLHEDVYVEVIADDHHLHRNTIDLIFRVKDHRRIVIVSDSVAGTHLCGGDGAVRDAAGRLQGGGLAVTESADLLAERGFDRGVLLDCITVNPARYLNLSP